MSAKNNHRAVKHSRLSSTIDFGKEWLGIPCSKEYFSKVGDVFNPLRSRTHQAWSSHPNKARDVYVPVLEAFKVELERIYKLSPKDVASSLIEHLVGLKDFYKVIKLDNVVEIQAFNLRGDLGLPFQAQSAKFSVPKVSLPSEIIEISWKPGSQTTLIVKCNNCWELSFRIHNASSNIEPSLKFDISLIRSPSTLFSNTLTLPPE